MNRWAYILIMVVGGCVDETKPVEYQTPVWTAVSNDVIHKELTVTEAMIVPARKPIFVPTIGLNKTLAAIQSECPSKLLTAPVGAFDDGVRPYVLLKHLNPLSPTILGIFSEEGKANLVDSQYYIKIEFEPLNAAITSVYVRDQESYIHTAWVVGHDERSGSAYRALETTGRIRMNHSPTRAYITQTIKSVDPCAVAE